ncbi:MFS transporter, SP family, sugar:H+ symporter [Galdieria sulphuraria]|uniref:MFS transporter, SP family, sugar:H+ symporter n=1 Tax=Galdieria sulphuraria TaxID=130081 RepID=M2XM33_GALSU|nr:MFS transporter, SP family, sugar:H+ symporter [Galdieria sulphuraria]EME31257.1 MFS transporter, SP family, sugar:H+ symporter [Galdieria sulphuraria]|eukprot:XP_005707777.1 MFS transporter, SP family, sugar:H+ symporter [Galdieria sulphuraria]
MSKNEEELSVIREPSTEVNEEGGDDKGVRYAITGHTEQEIDAELEKLEEGSIAKGGRRIFSSTLFGNPKYFIWVLASFASMGGILYGIDQSLISGAGLYVPTDLNYGSNKESMISGFMPLGGIFGAIMVYPTNELIGRKWSIIGACLLYTVGGILEADAQSWGMLLAGRMILGAGVALEAATVPGYIAECSTKRWRGGLVSLYQVMIMLGLLFGYIDAAIFVDVSGNWRWMLGSSLLFSTIFLIAMLFLPESPRYLMKVGKKLDSYVIWKRVRGFSTFEEKEEFFQMEQHVLEEIESAKGRFIWLDFINKPRCRHAAQYAIILMIIQQFSGINSVNYYMGTLMHETGLTKQQAVYTSMIGGGTGFLSTIPAIYLMDRLGRRTLLLSLISGVFIGLLIIGFSFLSSSTHTKEGIYIWGVVIYYLFWGSCLGPTPWVVGSEVWPTYLRSQGLFLTDITNWTGDFITTYAFPHMTAAMTNEGTFCGFYAGIVLIGTFYLMLFMPETKDKTLEELDQVFEQPLSDLMAENIQKLKETWDDLKSFRFSRVWALSK